MSSKIGIIGLGFVGGAVKHSFEKHFEILTYDIDPSKATSTIKEIVFECKFIFITLPTPMKEDGSCDLSIIHMVLSEMNKHLSPDNPSLTSCQKLLPRSERIAIIKSSIPPGTTKLLSEEYANISIVFSPEFLTERNANQDFERQDKVILGGASEYTEQAAHLFKKVCPLAHICETDFTTAEMVKFTINCFLATKVSVFNELYQICEKLNIDYNNMIGLSLLDNRIGSSHTQVPGWDGHFGFGGSCFPANINIMINTAKSLDIDTKVLRACWEKNLEVRPERDWEQLKGRAIV